MAEYMRPAAARAYEIPNGQVVDLIKLVATDAPESWVHPAEGQELTIGQIAYVWAMGKFRRGVITKLTKMKATVTFTTQGSVDQYRQAVAAGYEATAWGVRVQGTAANRETIYVAPPAAAPEPEATEQEHAEALAMNEAWDDEQRWTLGTIQDAHAEALEIDQAQELIEEENRFELSDQESGALVQIVARPTLTPALMSQMVGRILREDPLTFDLPPVLTLNSQACKVGSISEGGQPEQDREDPAAMTTTTFFYQPTETTEAEAKLVRPTYGSGVIRALENAWHFLMAQQSELPDVMMITGVGIEGLGGKWGHFRRSSWNVRQGETKTKLGEIFIAGETLAKGGRKVMNTMTHEAAHVIACVREVQDTSRQHRYHNGTFRKIAEELGMEYTPASPDKTIGFSQVTLREETVKAYEAIIEELDRAIQADVALPFWMGGGSEGGQDGDDNGDDEGGENVHGKRKPKDPNAPKTGNRKCICNCETPNIVYMSRKMIDKRVVECDDCDSLFREA